ncbi:hypothetical protein HDU67_000534 [Dinochytrium kinnereticum]|nr:hypothetical protein HDU67_000534 [Dinochytrium kinnereticum]
MQEANRTETKAALFKTGNKDWVNFSIVMEAFLDTSVSGPSSKSQNPITYDTTGVAVARTPNQQKTDKNDKNACLILLSKLSRANLQLVFNQSSTRKLQRVWDALKAIYATAAINNAVYLRYLLAEIH